MNRSQEPTKVENRRHTLKPKWPNNSKAYKHICQRLKQKRCLKLQYNKTHAQSNTNTVKYKYKKRHDKTLFNLRSPNLTVNPSVQKH